MPDTGANFILSLFLKEEVLNTLRLIPGPKLVGVVDSTFSYTTSPT